MKSLFILLVAFTIQIIAQDITIRGKVIDANTNRPLVNANIIVEGESGSGTVSDSEGYFSLTGIKSLEQVVEISYLGYEKVSRRVSEFLGSPDENLIKLTPTIITSQSILVKAIRGRQYDLPTTYSNIERSDIKSNYTVQDIPEFLSTLPSTTFYSESGNGIGYNYLSIRGFDQRRISVAINGVPQNDPEDHNVYWVDFPDLISSSEYIQVQRGSGSSMIGYPAIGGAINIITSPFANEPMFNIKSALGSYNTRKYSVSFSSGLLDQKYSFYARLSQILSSGYREKSWVKFNSYYVSAARFDENLTTQFNFFGGPIADGLVYNGLPKFAVKDKELRRKNYSYWETDKNHTKITYAIERRADEIENFSQPHFEILNDLKINDQLNLNSALFLVIGQGFFDYDGSWSVYYDDYFRLKQNGFDTNYIPTNALIRAQVENTQWGWIPKLNLKHTNGSLILGAEYRNHRSIHWGSINYAENLPYGISKDYRYYYYKGAKDIVNVFANENYSVTDKLSLLGELQLAYHKYRLYEERYVGNDFTLSNTFLNSRFGLNYKLSDYSAINLSYARVTREPRLKNYYDAAESSGGEVPQFEVKTDGSYDFTNPLVKPETMNDFELGGYYRTDDFSALINLFFMVFKDEIVKNGKLDRFGQPITGNMESTFHQGIELSLAFKPIKNLEIIMNSTLSKNIIRKGKYYVNATTFFDLNNNRISGFPDVLTNFIVNYKMNDLYLRLTGKYVGKFYTDNFDDKLKDYLAVSPRFVKYIENYNDAYITADFFCSYEFNIFRTISKSKIFFQVNNIFDRLYSAYAIGKEFFPAAGRNYLLGLQIGL